MISARFVSLKTTHSHRSSLLCLVFSEVASCSEHAQLGVMPSSMSICQLIFLNLFFQIKELVELFERQCYEVWCSLDVLDDESNETQPFNSYEEDQGMYSIRPYT